MKFGGRAKLGDSGQFGCQRGIPHHEEDRPQPKRKTGLPPGSLVHVSAVMMAPMAVTMGAEGLGARESARFNELYDHQ